MRLIYLYFYKSNGKEQFVGFTLDRGRQPKKKVQAAKGVKLLTETIVQHSAIHN